MQVVAHHGITARLKEGDCRRGGSSAYRESRPSGECNQDRSRSRCRKGVAADDSGRLAHLFIIPLVPALNAVLSSRLSRCSRHR